MCERGSSMKFCSNEIDGRLAEWLRCSIHSQKACNGTGSIPGGGRSLRKASTEGIVWGGEVKGNSNNFCTMTRYE